MERWKKMSSLWSRTATQRTGAVLFALLVALPVSYAQEPADTVSAPPPDVQDAAAQAAPQLSRQQLSNLVAPVALYPDPLLSQVLAASTYPLEIVEAHQWLGENKNLSGAQLMDAAKQQNWDPSVQALVAFPDALSLLANDIRWTTDLGNAFLAQQADVMSAVQDLRARARANGKLTNSQQQVVTTETQDGQSAIQIMPADPQVIYVPVYQPTYIWGPPAYGYYPDLWYPSWFSFGFGWGPGLYMSTYYPAWGGWGGWGWNCGWFGRGLYLNFSFFNHYGYRGYDYGRYRGFYGRGYSGRAVWDHNPGHRWGVAYPNRYVANRFNSGRYAGSGRGSYGGRNNFSGHINGSRYDSPRNSGSQFSRNGSGGWRTSGENNRGNAGRGSGFTSGNNGNSGWRSFGDGNRSQQGGRSSYGTNGRGATGTPRMSSPSSSSFGGRGGAETQSGRGFSSSQGSWSTRSNERSGGSSYSAPRSGGSNGGGFSSPRSAPAQRQNFSSGSSSGSFASPRSFGGGGGGFSAPRSYSAPSRSYSSPAPSGGSRGFGGGGGFSAPSRGFGGGGGGGFSAPSRGFGGGGFSGGGRSSGGGFSGGGGRSSGGFSGGGGRSGGGGGGGHRGR
jgi:hypothetical protein